MSRGGSRAIATSRTERFVIIVNGFQPLTMITKRSILDGATILDPPLMRSFIEVQFDRNLVCFLIFKFYYDNANIGFFIFYFMKNVFKYTV